MIFKSSTSRRKESFLPKPIETGWCWRRWQKKASRTHHMRGGFGWFIHNLSTSKSGQKEKHCVQKKDVRLLLIHVPEKNFVILDGSFENPKRCEAANRRSSSFYKPTLWFDVRAASHKSWTDQHIHQATYFLGAFKIKKKCLFFFCFFHVLLYLADS